VEKSVRHFIWVHRIKYDQRIYYKHIPHWYKALNPRISIDMIIFRRIIRFVAIKKNAKKQKFAYLQICAGLQKKLSGFNLPFFLIYSG